MHANIRGASMATAIWEENEGETAFSAGNEGNGFIMESDSLIFNL